MKITNKKIVEVLKSVARDLSDLRWEVHEHKLHHKIDLHECVESFSAYIVAKEGLVCPVCGHDAIILKLSSQDKPMENVVKCGSKHHTCVSVSDKDLLVAIEKFKKIKVEGENNG